jgi:hypothetical protein
VYGGPPAFSNTQSTTRFGFDMSTRLFGRPTDLPGPQNRQFWNRNPNVPPSRNAPATHSR